MFQSIDENYTLKSLDFMVQLMNQYSEYKVVFTICHIFARCLWNYYSRLV